MSTNVYGKIIVLTGAASGMGLATAKLLASRGAILLLADQNESLLSTATKGIFDSGAEVFITALDVRDRKAVESWIDSAVQKYGHLDGAVNLAGVIGKQSGHAKLENIDDEDWDFVLGVNLGGVLNCMRAEIKAMGNPKESGRKGASIINAASIAGLIGPPTHASYCASKHAVIGLTRVAAKECGARGIRVNAIAPGAFDTPMTQGQIKDIAQQSIVSVPAGRFGQPEEIAELICWLLCDESTYITGTTQVIDGGMLC